MDWRWLHVRELGWWGWRGQRDCERVAAKCNLNNRLLSRRNISQLATMAAVLLWASLGQASLVNEWTGDGYTSGNWVDGVGSVTATASGSPLSEPNAFNSHAGVTMNGGYFLI